MHHYVYCIENLIDGKIYVGKHSTENMDDGYMGSGLRIRRAITKHGLENFRRHILKDDFISSEEALEFEKLLITQEFVSDENTYNLTLGVGGGNIYFKLHPEKQFAFSSAGGKAVWKNDLNREARFKRNTVLMKRLWDEGKVKLVNWTGRRHNDETKQKIGAANAIAQSGEKNSQFGTCWISHPELKKSQRVNKGDVEGYLAEGWIKGRKMKW